MILFFSGGADREQDLLLEDSSARRIWRALRDRTAFLLIWWRISLFGRYYKDQDQKEISFSHIGTEATDLSQNGNIAVEATIDRADFQRHRF